MVRLSRRTVARRTRLDQSAKDAKRCCFDEFNFKRMYTRGNLTSCFVSSRVRIKIIAYAYGVTVFDNSEIVSSLNPAFDSEMDNLIAARDYVTYYYIVNRVN